MGAAAKGSPDTVLRLLEAGADGSLRDIFGNTAFFYAEQNDKIRDTDAYWSLNEARFQ